MYNIHEDLMKSNKLLTINHSYFDKALRVYLDNKPTFLAFIRPKEASFFNALLPYKEPVMDFGCGDGFFRFVSNLGSAQKFDIGLEVNRERARIARKAGVYKKVVTYDGKQIPFQDEKFFTIVSNSVMEHIVDVDNSIREIYRVLAKDGSFYVSVMADQYEENLLGTILLGVLYRKWMRKKAYHFSLLSQYEWEKKFQEVGFKIQQRVGYMSRKNTRFLDLMQYLSIPAIILSTRFPFGSRLYYRTMGLLLNRFIKHNILSEKNSGNCSAYFYILTK